jgi:hypothetical protein
MSPVHTALIGGVAIPGKHKRTWHGNTPVNGYRPDLVAPSTTPPAVYAGLPTPAVNHLCSACTVIRRAALVGADGRALCMSCWCERVLRQPA